MGGKSKEHLLKKLLDVPKMLEGKTERQGQMVKELQMLVTNKRLFSQIVDFFPYPIAIFSPQHTLTMVNKVFKEETKIQLMNPDTGSARILRYKIDNIQLAAVLKRVFAGETFYLENLTNPLSMFSGIIQQEVPQPDRFKKAVVFPVSSDNSCVTHGVVVFMP